VNEPYDAVVFEGLADLVSRARKGDQMALPLLRHYLDSHPEVWRRCGDLALTTREMWLNLFAGPDLFVAESVRRKLDEMKADLGGPNPSSLESLLVDRVLACWLQVHHADASAAQARGSDASPAHLREMMKRQESSQKRYLASLKQLAVVRKLLGRGSALQVVMCPPASLRLAGSDR
jgi:hypothetical protein